MWVVCKKELHAFLDSLMGYVVIGGFLSSLGLFLWFFPDSNIFAYGYADMRLFFDLCPFVLLFLVPAITMRSYAEERRAGTLELLLSAPISARALVIGKFLACVALLCLCLAPSLVYFGSLYALGNPQGNIDGAQVAGSYFGLLLLGSAFSAIGQTASALCKNQLVAFVIGTFICFACYFGLSAIAKLDKWGWKGAFAEQMSLSHHYNSLGKGLVELNEVAFFIGFISFFLLLTAQIVQHKR